MAGFQKYYLTCDIKTGLLRGDDVDVAKFVQCGGNVYLANNKYQKEEMNEEKIGKWMLFPPKKSDELEKIWNRIKDAVKAGKLWKVKLSLMDPSKPINRIETNCAIMIYTKDYEDIEDVIEVLDILESSGIKDHVEEIKYKTNQHTRAGVYSNAFKLTARYSSKTVRTQQAIILDKSSETTFEYDIEKKKITRECKIPPSDKSHPELLWIYARNNKYPNSEISREAMGKWMIFLNIQSIDSAWSKIKQAVMEGHLWFVNVSTANNLNQGDEHAIFVFTKDYRDIIDVIKVLDYLENSEIKPPNTAIAYRIDQQNRGGKTNIYYSATIRNKQSSLTHDKVFSKYC